MTARLERKQLPNNHFLFLQHDDYCANLCRTIHLDGFWSRGIGNEGSIRIPDEDGA